MADVDRTERIVERLPCDRARVLAYGLLIPIHVLLLAWIACRTSPTSDEVAHLAAGVRIWQMLDFSTYTVNPPLVKTWAALPVVLSGPRSDWRRHSDNPAERKEWNVGQDFLYANVPNSLWYFTLARWVCIPFGVLGLIYCDRWARDLWGSWAGFAAACAWCFHPEVLGNGALITPDVASASLGIAALYHFRNWILVRRWTDAFISGGVLGLVLLTKLSWLLLGGFLPALLAADTLLFRGLPRPSGRRTLLQGAMIAVIALDILWMGYAYQKIGQPLGSFSFVSRTLKGTDAPTGNRFRDTPLTDLPVPFPADWVTGIDLQKRDFEQGWRPLESYLRGQHRNHGWWYYYLYGALVKTPVGLLAATLLTAVAIALTWRSWEATARRNLLLLLFVPTLLFIFISCQTGFSRYYRYVLPCLPAAMIANGFVWTERFGRVKVPLRCLSGFCLMLAAWESLTVTPHQLGFYNRPAGGPESGHLHLLDSNTDWGQDLYALKDWTHAHPEARPLYLAYAGVADPGLFDLQHEEIPVSATGEIPQLAPGWYAVSVNHLHDYDHPEPRYSYFQRLTPVDRAGYSILIYHVPAGGEGVP